MTSAMRWVRLDPSEDVPVNVGDLVSADAGGMPIFHVLRVERDRLWVEDDRHAALVRPLDAFRWKARS